MSTELAGWRDGRTREALITFVRSVTESVPEIDRVATFDNDGTLWCEKPFYVQADFVLRTWKAMLERDPSLAERQPYKALAEGDQQWLAAMTDHLPDLVRGLSEAYAGLTTDEFETRVRQFFDDAQHPTLGTPYNDVAYAPMKELLRFLEANGFRVFICSAGGRDFVRAVSEELYGVPRERVIGSSAPLEFRDGRLVRVPGVEQPIDDGAGKPVHIWARIGRPPLFAAGNANGDVEMLSQAKFSLLVHHDDAEREFAYDEGADAALAAARAGGWTVASMRSDFVTIFG